jgi:CheY-like chemotaxis protein
MPLRVLLADDSVPAQNMGKKILVEAGYDVLTASNGLEALRKIASNPPDIAILDIFMPGYNGLEICERLRASAATATLPVILTVGKLEPYRPEDGEHVHSNAIIVKPFAAAELISAVRSLIGTALSHPQLGVEAPSADMPAEPLPEAGLAAIVEPAPAPATPAPVEEEVADEPLFSYGPSEASGNTGPRSSRMPSVYADALHLSGTDSNRPESLVFNPDAEPAPFSASVLDDLLPSTSHYPEHNPPTFTEFDLEPQSSPYFSTPVPREPAASEPSFSTAAGTAGPEPEVLMPEASPAPDEILSGSGATLEPASASLNIPALDPLLELPEADLPDFEPLGTVDAAEPLDPLTPQIPAAYDEPVPEPLSPEEEARRLAFEELFNSPEPLPLDDFCPQSAATAAAPLPQIAAPANHHPDVFAPDPELELLNIDSQPDFLAPQANRYPPMAVELIEVEPLSTIGAIPERDPLLEETLEENRPEAAGAPVPETKSVPEPETAGASEPEAAFARASSEPASPQPGEVAEVAPPETSLAAASAESPQTFTDAHPEAPEVLEPEPEPETAGLAQTAGTEEIPEAALTSGIELPSELPQVFQTADEAAPPQPEPQQIVPEAVPQQIIPEAEPPETPQAPPEPVSSAPVLLLATSEPEIGEVAQFPMAAAIDAAAELVGEPELPQAAPEAASLATQQAEPESVRCEAPAPEDAAFAPPGLETPEPVSPEPEPLVVQPSSSELSLGPNDVERVNQAVDRVFDRFKRLLVRAILRELSRPD